MKIVDTFARAPVASSTSRVTRDSIRTAVDDSAYLIDALSTHMDKLAQAEPAAPGAAALPPGMPPMPGAAPPAPAAPAAPEAPPAPPEEEKPVNTDTSYDELFNKATESSAATTDALAAIKQKVEEGDIKDVANGTELTQTPDKPSNSNTSVQPGATPVASAAAIHGSTRMGSVAPIHANMRTAAPDPDPKAAPAPKPKVDFKQKLKDMAGTPGNVLQYEKSVAPATDSSVAPAAPADPLQYGTGSAPTGWSWIEDRRAIQWNKNQESPGARLEVVDGVKKIYKTLQGDLVKARSDGNKIVWDLIESTGTWIPPEPNHTEKKPAGLPPFDEMCPSPLVAKRIFALVRSGQIDKIDELRAKKDELGEKFVDVVRKQSSSLYMYAPDPIKPDKKEQSALYKAIIDEVKRRKLAGESLSTDPKFKVKPTTNKDTKQNQGKIKRQIAPSTLIRRLGRISRLFGISKMKVSGRHGGFAEKRFKELCADSATKKYMYDSYGVPKYDSLKDFIERGVSDSNQLIAAEAIKMRDGLNADINVGIRTILDAVYGVVKPKDPKAKRDPKKKNVWGGDKNQEHEDILNYMDTEHFLRAMMKRDTWRPVQDNYSSGKEIEAINFQRMALDSIKLKPEHFYKKWADTESTTYEDWFKNVFVNMMPSYKSAARDLYKNYRATVRAQHKTIKRRPDHAPDANIEEREGKDSLPFDKWVEQHYGTLDLWENGVKEYEAVSNQLEDIAPGLSVSGDYIKRQAENIIRHSGNNMLVGKFDVETGQPIEEGIPEGYKKKKDINEELYLKLDKIAREINTGPDRYVTGTYQHQTVVMSKIIDHHKASDYNFWLAFLQHANSERERLIGDQIIQDFKPIKEADIRRLQDEVRTLEQQLDNAKKEATFTDEESPENRGSIKYAKSILNSIRRKNVALNHYGIIQHLRHEIAALEVEQKEIETHISRNDAAYEAGKDVKVVPPAVIDEIKTAGASLFKLAIEEDPDEEVDNEEPAIDEDEEEIDEQINSIDEVPVTNTPNAPADATGEPEKDEVPGIGVGDVVKSEQPPIAQAPTEEPVEQDDTEPEEAPQSPEETNADIDKVVADASTAAAAVIDEETIDAMDFSRDEIRAYRPYLECSKILAQILDNTSKIEINQTTNQLSHNAIVELHRKNEELIKSVPVKINAAITRTNSTEWTEVDAKGKKVTVSLSLKAKKLTEKLAFLNELVNRVHTSVNRHIQVSRARTDAEGNEIKEQQVMSDGSSKALDRVNLTLFDMNRASVKKGTQEEFKGIAWGIAETEKQLKEVHVLIAKLKEEDRQKGIAFGSEGDWRNINKFKKLIEKHMFEEAKHLIDNALDDMDVKNIIYRRRIENDEIDTMDAYGRRTTDVYAKIGGTPSPATYRVMRARLINRRKELEADIANTLEIMEVHVENEAEAQIVRSELDKDYASLTKAVASEKGLRWRVALDLDKMTAELAAAKFTYTGQDSLQARANEFTKLQMFRDTITDVSQSVYGSKFDLVRSLSMQYAAKMAELKGWESGQNTELSKASEEKIKKSKDMRQATLLRNFEENVWTAPEKPEDVEPDKWSWKPGETPLDKYWPAGETLVGMERTRDDNNETTGAKPQNFKKDEDESKVLFGGQPGTNQLSTSNMKGTGDKDSLDLKKNIEDDFGMKMDTKETYPSTAISPMEGIQTDTSVPGEGYRPLKPGTISHETYESNAILGQIKRPKLREIPQYHTLDQATAAAAAFSDKVMGTVQYKEAIVEYHRNGKDGMNCDELREEKNMPNLDEMSKQCTVSKECGSKVCQCKCHTLKENKKINKDYLGNNFIQRGEPFHTLLPYPIYKKLTHKFSHDGIPTARTGIDNHQHFAWDVLTYEELTVAYNTFAIGVNKLASIIERDTQITDAYALMHKKEPMTEVQKRNKEALDSITKIKGLLDPVVSGVDGDMALSVQPRPGDGKMTPPPRKAYKFIINAAIAKIASRVKN
jgi:hypothetical protein